MKFFPFLSLLLYSCACFAQGEANIWYFGENAGVDFNSGAPVGITNGSLSTSEGCATISDRNGNLIFYSDGRTGWTRTHAQMPNGTGLMGDNSSAQSAIIVPKPGDPTWYYLFTVDDNGGPNGLRYSEVDMTLNGGLGDVVASSKNTLLFTPSAEKITAVKHANGLYVWVIAHGMNNNRYHAYLVNCNGVQPAVTTNIGRTEGQPGWGYLVASPNGQKLASAMNSIGFELLDFNNATGTVSNPVFLGQAGACYGVSFSPNNNVLYGLKIANGEIYQWNVQAGSAAAISASATYLGNARGTNSPYRGGALQLGPDGRLYICQFRQPYLSVITQPDVLGTGCNLQFDAVNLIGRDAILGLPPFIQSFFDTGAVIQSSGNCAGEPVLFSSSGSTTLLDSIRWDFGDPASGALNRSSLPAPTHVYSTGGTYTVQFFRYLDCITDTTVLVLNISDPKAFTQDITICTSVTFTRPGGTVVSTPGTYYDTLAAASGCDSVITTNLSVLGASITVSNDTAICAGNSVQLNVQGGLFGQTWTPATGLNDSTLINPIATPQQTTTYTVHTQVASDELISNGDFSAGGGGFYSAYSYTTNLNPEGTYYVGSNPNSYHSGFSGCGDHTSGSGNMMIVNGSGTPGTQVWCQTVNVLPATNYAFSCWVTSVVAGSPAILQFSINGSLLGAPFNAPASACPWQQFYVIWNSGSNTSATICVVNQNTTLGGNDFALDDISFIGLCNAVDTVTVTVNHPVTTIIDTTICQGIVYWFPDGSSSAVAVSNTSLLTGQHGCDSTVITNLTVNPSPVTQVFNSICSGTSFTRPSGIIVTDAGVYTDSLTTFLGCDSIIITNLAVNPAPLVNYYDSICLGYPYTRPGGTTVTDAGIYTDSIFTTAGCDSIVITHLSLKSSKHFAFDDTVCAGSAYNLPDGNIAQEPGDHIVIIPAQNGCDSTITVSLLHYEIGLNVSPPVSVPLGEAAQISATSGYDPAIIYHWTPSTALTCTNCATPDARPLQNMRYQVEAVANIKGNPCTDTASVLVTVEPNRNLFIPNAFTPNNDGSNDFFEVFGNLFALSGLEVKIFDRSGEKVFESADIHFKWNGRFKDQLLNPDVFVYTVEVSYIDGYPNKFYKGSVALIR